MAVEQRLKSWDWRLEVSQPSILAAPDDATGSGTGQGQLGLGSTYYASNGGNPYPAAAFLKQGFARFNSEQSNLRIGRFEFVEGMETKPADHTIAWMQQQRIAHRLIGNFGFSNGQRSFDGLDLHSQMGPWNITAFAARADQGVFNMNGNPELNVDVQYLALTRAMGKHVLWRGFAIGFHDGRTGLTKTDNRSASLRATDHANIRIGTYGGNLLASIPAGPGQFDFLFWGAAQNGSWGSLSHKAGAATVEGGYQWGKVATRPWVRGGWFRSTGDENATDNSHNTYFQVLPTPRIYARLPFYNQMNSTEGFVQLMDQPVKAVALRSELHWLKLTSPHDLWYLGGGAFDNKVFGYVGRPANGTSSLASVADISADWHATKTLDLNFYYAYAQGKTVVSAIYPTGRNMQYGYVECVYHWSLHHAGN
ncbi:MAG: hypothetical protein KGN79_15470 [Acidobacteriota bacterium]|nr:hypothetical protein [Acidobacteriota bacterium]